MLWACGVKRVWILLALCAIVCPDTDPYFPTDPRTAQDGLIQDAALRGVIAVRQVPTPTPTTATPTTVTPTEVPTPSPSPSPTHVPTTTSGYSTTREPTDVPTPLPTPTPTEPPTHWPTRVPTHAPTRPPSPSPTRRRERFVEMCSTIRGEFWGVVLGLVDYPGGNEGLGIS